MQNQTTPSTTAEKLRIKRAFLQSEGLREHAYTGHCCIDRVKGQRCRGVECRWPSGIPAFDHGSAFRRGSDQVLVYQPYEFTDLDRQRLTALCQEHGLQWRELPEFSWHFPGWTNLIVIDKNPNAEVGPRRGGATR